MVNVKIDQTKWQRFVYSIDGNTCYFCSMDRVYGFNQVEAAEKIIERISQVVSSSGVKSWVSIDTHMADSFVPGRYSAVSITRRTQPLVTSGEAVTLPEHIVKAFGWMIGGVRKYDINHEDVGRDETLVAPKGMSRVSFHSGTKGSFLIEDYISPDAARSVAEECSDIRSFGNAGTYFVYDDAGGTICTFEGEVQPPSSRY